jgi:hypothetical protein
MRWLVEITDIVANEHLFTGLLAKLNLTLYLEDGRTYLTGDEFELLSTDSEVWERAERLHDVVSEISDGFPDASISFQLGHLYEQKENGSRNSYIFSSIGLGLSMSSISEVLAITSASEISEEEKARLEAERLECEYEEKLALVSSRVVSAFRDERALKVHRFLQQDLTPVRMYHIYELIRDDLGGEKNMDSLASETETSRFKKECSRFRLSVNHQQVFGDDSRHASLKEEPPANPMSLDEAQAFIVRIADVWFKQKST